MKIVDIIFIICSFIFSMEVTVYTTFLAALVAHILKTEATSTKLTGSLTRLILISSTFSYIMYYIFVLN